MIIKTNNKLSILISTIFDNPKELGLLLEDLSKQSYAIYEVVLLIQRVRNDLFSNAEVDLFLRQFQNNINLKYAIYDEKGLSKSRNKALQMSTGDIVLFADDDCRYYPDTCQKILLAFKKLPEAQIITFQAARNDYKLFKNYNHHVFRHNILSLMRVSSIEVAMRRNVFINTLQLFDERFGLGTDLRTGEENIMVCDLYRKGYKMFFYPEIVVKHEDLTSSNSWSDDKVLLYAKGAMFKRMLGKWGLLLMTMFLLKKLLMGQFQGSISSMNFVIKGFIEFSD